MADGQLEVRESAWRQLFPWTELFRCFKVAVDPNKLLLAAAGILTTAIGWWVLAVIFQAQYPKVAPEPESYQAKEVEAGDVETRAREQERRRKEKWEQFLADRNDWNLVNATAGIRGGDFRYEVSDLIEEKAQYDAVKRLVADKKEPNEASLAACGLNPEKIKSFLEKYNKPKPFGFLSTWPWFEDRGPNPYLLVTGKERDLYEPGHFWEWFSTRQLPVILEPLIKLVSPIVYFFSPRASTYSRIYFLLVTLWTAVVWSFFGGAITRIAAVEVARNEKIGILEATNYARQRLLAYFSAPLFPLLFVFLLVIFSALFGIPFLIPFVGDMWAGLLWWIPLLLGLGMACTLLGLAVGWPLMAPTISAEGADSWEAVSRSFSYVYTRPWHYLWYTLVGTIYGAIAVFFVGFMGSFLVYLASWGVKQTPFISLLGRLPNFLFIYAPTSFDWRKLLLSGVADSDVASGLAFYNKVGAGMVSFWLYLLFLMMIGFGYSFFWSMSTIIYLLMRRHVDSAELDEVYLEEEDTGSLQGGFPTAPGTSADTKKEVPGLQMVDPPTLRKPAETSSSTTASSSPASNSSSGSPDESKKAKPDLKETTKVEDEE